MSWFELILIAIIEGITEFLPVSSTGHMIIAQSILGVENSDFVKAFIVNIQFGAILSVVVLYWKKFTNEIDFKRISSAFKNHSVFASIFWKEIFYSKIFYLKLFAAFIPAAVIGFLAGDYIDMMLENVIVVAISLFLGGIILLFVDKWFKNPSEKQDLKFKNAFVIGLYQCIAMIPGVSRSAATIIGGMAQKLNRKNAAEFSFFLAVPTMLAASAYKLLKNYEIINSDNISQLLVGNAVAFIVAMIAIKTFIALLTKYGFKAFGVYRIIVGAIIILLYSIGYELTI
ncbi:MAG TPA: UDP-diphosphatase [Bacteroidales bacterium]|nr:MAG: undecaprenyl-diphosphatase UppP [Bacteroidetes bacterium GWF2_33_38]OFY75401.1 MAG: undecaprenyl-diphosphatase UppP [Bacteroidetes bacterium RIFOXYA12_FULL_33_9]OFY84974.1 MAG: undecaprenyl-diphosphatase UppP [Bacteroidetes bacterium RIFOXYA2_FULL_33_7]HBF87441.1 UDP-diphosphatase [Bacteroidales bacterium]